MQTVSAIIVAGGSSSRFGADKLFLNIGGMSVLERSVALMQNNALISEIVIAAKEESLDKVKELSKAYSKVTAVVKGGATRLASTLNAIAATSKKAEYYAIHDAARPFASDALVTRVIKAAFVSGAAAPAVPVVDTIKTAQNGIITGTPDRDKLFAVATPQVFNASLYNEAAKGNSEAFDDCLLLERHGERVTLVEGERNNIKITTKEDIARAKAIAGACEMRIGHGYDVHKLVSGRKLILGGVEIPHETGLLGHSDADVLVHAVMDALLGAAALGDIGKLFPDSDEKYKGADSLALLKEVSRVIAENGFSVVNVDATVLCERPKLRPYIDEMRKKIAAGLGIEPSRVSVKATTEEGLGFTGSKEGIAAHALALLN